MAEYNSRFGLECHSLDWDPCSCYTAGTAVDRASLDSGVLVGKRDEAVAHVGDLQLRKVYLLLFFCWNLAVSKQHAVVGGKVRVGSLGGLL